MSARRFGFCSVILLSVCALAAVHPVDAEPGLIAQGVPPAGVLQVHPPEPPDNDVPPRLATNRPGIRIAKRYFVTYRLVAAPVNGVPTEKLLSAGEISSAEEDQFFVHGSDEVVASGAGELVWFGPNCRGQIRPANEQDGTQTHPAAPAGISPAGELDSPVMDRIQRIEQRLEALERREQR